MTQTEYVKRHYELSSRGPRVYCTSMGIPTLISKLRSISGSHEDTGYIVGILLYHYYRSIRQKYPKGTTEEIEMILKLEE